MALNESQTTSLNFTLKIALHQRCIQLAEERILVLKNTLHEVQEAVNNETKSTVGDKHETGRAMAQLETEKLAHQLNEALKLLQSLEQINPNIKHHAVTLGSCITTNHGNFYIAASLGQLEIDGITYFAISPLSPIGQRLIGLKPNDHFTFNERKYIINQIE